MKASHDRYGKKLLPLLIILLFAHSLLSALNVNIASVSAVESPYIVVVPESIVDPTLISGDNFTISIYTNYGEDVMTEWDVTSYQFTLFYNPNVLNGVNVTNGDVIVDGPADFIAGVFDNEVGNLSITVGFYAGLGQVTGMHRWPGPFNGTLAYITFTVVGKGTSNITVGPQTKLIGWNFTETTDYNIINATFTNADTWPGDGVTSVFYTTEKPIAIYSEKVHVNETLMSQPANYTIDYDTGEITFTTAPGLGEEIEATYDYINYDHIQHGYFDNRFQHDVAVGSVTAPDKTGVGELVPINVTVANIGKSDEVANVTIRYDTTYIDSQNVTLVAGENKPVSFSWNTTGVMQGPYTINATATIAGDGDLTDNWKNTTILIAVHDVAVGDILAPTVYVGECVDIRVLVENKGWYRETFEVKGTVSYDTTVIETQTQNVTLTKDESKHVFFSWNTTGVAPGSYTITAEAILDGDVEPTNNRGTLSFTLEFPPGAIAGRVTDSPTNDPIGGANVTANGYSDTTDADGYYNITDVPPGSYTVTVSAAKHINQSKTATVTPSTTTALDFTLAPLNGTISGTVTESSTGDPVSGANVTANGVSVSTDTDGSYSIELAPGTYNVTVSADGYEGDSKSATVAAEKTTVVDFELIPTPPPNISWQLYVAIAGVTAIVMVALAFYFLRIRKTKPT